MLQSTTLTQKGQITIPLFLRQRLKLKTGQQMVFLPHPEQPGILILKPITDLISLKGKFKSHKKYNKTRARATFTKDISKI